MAITNNYNQESIVKLLLNLGESQANIDYAARVSKDYPDFWNRLSILTNVKLNKNPEYISEVSKYITDDKQLAYLSPSLKTKVLDYRESIKPPTGTSTPNAPVPGTTEYVNGALPEMPEWAQYGEFYTAPKDYDIISSKQNFIEQGITPVEAERMAREKAEDEALQSAKTQYEQKNTTLNQNERINTFYAPAYENMFRTLTGAASKRGGLDAGGYLTSLAKGSAEIDAAKAGAMIDWDKFLESLKLPQAQFEWQKTVQFPESVREFNVGTNLTKTQMATQQKQYDQQIKALQDLYASQNKTNWWDPIVEVAGSIAGGFSGKAGELLASKWIK